MPLFLHREPSYAALPPYTNVLLQKTLTSMWEAAWKTFCPTPTLHPSPPPQFCLSPSTPLGQLLASSLWPSLCSAVVLLYAWSQQVIQAHQNPGYTWNTKAVLYVHRFSLFCPRKRSQLCFFFFFFKCGSQLRKKFEPFLSKDSYFGYWNILSCGLAESSWPICFLSKCCHEDPLHTLLLWPHPTSMFFFRGYLYFTHPE